MPGLGSIAPLPGVGGKGYQRALSGGRWIVPANRPSRVYARASHSDSNPNLHQRARRFGAYESRERLSMSRWATATAKSSRLQ
jgi:hypothetical protein